MTKNILINGLASLKSLDHYYYEAGITPYYSNGKKGMHLELADDHLMDLCGKVTKQFNNGYLERYTLGLLSRRAETLINQARSLNISNQRPPIPESCDDANLGRLFLVDLALALRDLNYATVVPTKTGLDCLLTEAFFRALKIEPRREKTPEHSVTHPMTLEKLYALIPKEDQDDFSKFCNEVDQNFILNHALMAELENWNETSTSISFYDLSERIQKRIPLAEAHHRLTFTKEEIKNGCYPNVVVGQMSYALAALDPSTTIDTLLTALAQWAKSKHFTMDKTSVAHQMDTDLANFIGNNDSDFMDMPLIKWWQRNHISQFPCDSAREINFECVITGFNYIFEHFKHYHNELKDQDPSTYIQSIITLSHSEEEKFAQIEEAYNNYDFKQMIEFFEDFCINKQRALHSLDRLNKNCDEWEEYLRNPDLSALEKRRVIMVIKGHEFFIGQLIAEKQLRQVYQAIEQGNKDQVEHILADVLIEIPKNELDQMITEWKEKHRPEQFAGNTKPQLESEILEIGYDFLNRQPMDLQKFDVNEMEDAELEADLLVDAAQEERDGMLNAIKQDDDWLVQSILKKLLNSQNLDFKTLQGDYDHWASQLNTFNKTLSKAEELKLETLTLGIDYLSQINN